MAPMNPALSARLHAAAEANALYATLDLAAYGPRTLHELGPSGAKSVCLFSGLMVDDGEDVSPWLLPVCGTALQRELAIANLWRLSQQAPGVTWIESPLSLADLALRLHRRVEVKLPHGVEAILRSYDPRVLQELHGCLCAEHRGTYFALGTAWHYLDRDDRMQCVALATAPAADPLQAPLSLAQAEETALAEVSEADQAALQVRAHLDLAGIAIGNADLHRLSRRTVQELGALGRETLADRVSLLVIAAHAGTGFFDQPGWQQARAELAHGRLGWEAAMDLLAAGGPA